MSIEIKYCHWQNFEHLNVGATVIKDIFPFFLIHSQAINNALSRI
jgi:hypothetical protein